VKFGDLFLINIGLSVHSALVAELLRRGKYELLRYTMKSARLGTFPSKLQPEMFPFH